MALQEFSLRKGDVIAVRCCVGSPGCDAPEYRWIRAEIIDCEPGSWPLALLADGQLSEIRPFMSWRPVTGRSSGPTRGLAA
jgi:hypothetical protein